MATEKRLIDANALQNLLLPIAMGLEKEYGSLGGAITGVMMHIDNAPTVDAVEVVHGRWEHKKFWKNSIQYHTNECSICHNNVSSRNAYQYCPHCGARMDLKEG